MNIICTFLFNLINFVPDYTKYTTAAVGIGHSQMPEHIEGDLEATDDTDNVDDHQNRGVVLDKVHQGMHMSRPGHHSKSPFALRLSAFSLFLSVVIHFKSCLPRGWSRSDARTFAIDQEQVKSFLCHFIVPQTC